MKQVLWYLLAGTRGGPTRAQIMHALKKEPRNAHKLAQALDYDYKTITYHLRQLEKHGLVSATGDYGAIYFVDAELEATWEDYEEIWERVGTS